MSTLWIPTLIDQVVNQLRDDAYWESRLRRSRSSDNQNFHLAIFTQPLFQFIIDGKKTVESRFSITRCAPYSQVKKGDVVFAKESGGPVKAIAEVGNVWFYELDDDELGVIKTRFGRMLCVNDEFWRSKATCSYATLMCFSKVRPIEPVECEKKDRRGWVVLRRGDDTPRVLEDLSTRGRTGISSGRNLVLQF
jgi:hypothetical protein